MKTSREGDGKKRLKLNIYMRRKLTIAFGVASAVLFALALYLVFLIRDSGESYQKQILQQQDYSSTVLPFRRGAITDRNGTVLAYSEEVFTLILDPSVILYSPKNDNAQPNRNATVQALVNVFGFEAADINKVLDEKPDSRYIRYARLLTLEQKTAFEKLQEEYNTAEDAQGRAVHSDEIKASGLKRNTSGPIPRKHWPAPCRVSPARTRRKATGASKSITTII